MAATQRTGVEAWLARLARAVSRRRRAVIAVWLVLLAGSAWFSLHQTDHLSGGGWEVPGSASIRVSKLIDTFPGVTPPTFTFFVTGSSPAAGAGSGSRRSSRRCAGRRGSGPERRCCSPADGRRSCRSNFVGATSNSIDEATKLRHAFVQTSPAVQTRVLGEPAVWSNFQQVSKRQLARGEAIGFPLILLILLAAFGTVVAAVAPLALGFAAVFVSGAVIYWLSRSFEISIYVTNMASMIGIGVAVDYSLFIVSRFRSELHEGSSTDSGARPRPLDLGQGRRLQRRDGGGLARRAVRDRRERDPLARDRRDHRRLHLRPRRDDAPPGAARRAWDRASSGSGCRCPGARGRRAAARSGRRGRRR